MQFVLGVQDVCPREIFSSLRPSALQSVIEGRRDIDVAEWRRNADVKGVSESNETVSRFWDVVSSLSASDRSKLLCFAIGTTSLPARGFSELQPKFQLVVQPTESSDLPTSHTCFHMLVIPRYPSTEVMKEKLLMAIRETDTAHLGMI
jgi:E3 ubiquitin-protein ligase NEDD4